MMSPRAERISEAVFFAGLCGFVGALYWALPGYVALGVASLLLVGLGAGLRGAAMALFYGVAGVEEEMAKREPTSAK